MTPDIRWLGVDEVLVLHAESLRLFGGAAGMRDQGLLEGALARPQHRLAYVPDATLCVLTAALGHGVIKAHAFVDGNKRTGLLAMQTFLFLNGYRLHPHPVEMVTTIEHVAAGRVDESGLRQWLEQNTSPLTPRTPR